MNTSLDLAELSVMDALDLAILIEEEALQRYKLFVKQIGQTAGGHDAGSFFASMVENEAKHGTELLDKRMKLFGKAPMNLSLNDLFDVEAPDIGASRRGMSTIQAFEVALAAEQKAYDFYDGALPGITNPEVKELFAELRDEEAEHVQMLQEAMAKLPASASVETPNDPDDAPFL